ncbi:MAG: hypothetical protein AMXMBFR84_35600 [Candidatus Hydrogenedentota bacterium]
MARVTCLLKIVTHHAVLRINLRLFSVELGPYLRRVMLDPLALAKLWNRIPRSAGMTHGAFVKLWVRLAMAVHAKRFQGLIHQWHHVGILVAGSAGDFFGNMWIVRKLELF